MVVWGPGSLWMYHAHHSVQVTLALTGSLRVRTHSTREWRSCQVVLVPPDVGHEMDARGALILIAFLDPEGDQAISLLDEVGSDVRPVGDDVAARWREVRESSQIFDSRRVDVWMAAELSNGRRSRRMDAGVTPRLHQ